MTTTVPRPELIAENGGARAAFQGYLERLRGGDVGSVPAVTGLVALVLFFSIARPDSFATTRNFANLLVQGAPIIFIAMGLVFVLLLGEIDLGAGFTAGTAAAVVAVLMTNHGVAWPVAVVACVLTGAAIGLVLGLLVALLNIPSFVVTLASFLALQGVLLLVIGQGGTIPVNDSTILSLMNDNLPPWLGWAGVAVIVAGYAALALAGSARRTRSGLEAPPAGVLVFKIVALAVILAVVTFLLNQERAVNPTVRSLKGIPVVVPVTIVFLLVLTFVLSRTAFGRHVYAVGGNAEAARRAGITVPWVRISCFVISSSLAAVAGILYASYNNSVSPTTGGASTLLYAVGAAVIGGTSLFGGKGRVIDAIIGGLVVATIQNGLLLITSQSGAQYIVTGAVLLLAASVDAISRRRVAATGR
ncbi:sugar ABC transporter permease [Kineosporia succinea]|uniref:Xylose transport system permease protein XylH n=1 Tax=Kineosporia succinea TaxID=84632 RepID=A0ABT9P8L7_9ACTN|nr:ABC transporter permease [Kineosporia succinea]MDP9829047.1 D-xylose transport system permease protein [Kineosporia succinea]